jgi:TolB protein
MRRPSRPSCRRLLSRGAVVVLCAVAAGCAGTPGDGVVDGDVDGDVDVQPAAAPRFVAHPDDPAEPRLTNVRQLTFGGDNAEAYWSWRGDRLVFQASRRLGLECDQIFVMQADGGGERMLSTGLGRTTCGFFLPGDREVVYASTHHVAPECPEPPAPVPGVYTWPLHRYDIFRASAADGSGLVRLTDSPGYDAEPTVGPDGRIVFTSSRDGDLDVYSMWSDGSDVVRLTDSPGYDGGAFFSPDGTKIVFRRQVLTDPDAIATFRARVAAGRVEPTELDIWVMDRDGTNQRRVVDLPGANWCPFFHPDGRRVVFSSNWEDPQRRRFDLYVVNLDGTGLERVTSNPEFDAFPMFSPDGRRLVWCSNRHGAAPRDTNVFVADWVEPE